MKRVAIYGGSFNPPHLAHQMTVLWLLSTDRADAVWLVPCFQHAFQKHLAPFHHRVELCRLATEIFPADRVSVSTVEAELGGESRTLFTLQKLIADNPDCRFSFVMGTDVYRERTQWFRFDAIEQLVSIIVIGRKGVSLDEESLDLPVTMPEISSTHIRQALRDRLDVSNWVPARVLDYIKKNQLYVEE